MASSTMLDVMNRSARQAGGAGARFHQSPKDSTFLSYADLDRQGRHEAVLLRLAGLEPGDRIVLAFRPGLDFLRAVYAAMYAGVVLIPAPITVSHSIDTVRQRILSIAADSGARHVLSTGDLADGLGDLGPDISTVILSDSGGSSLADDWRHPGTRADDIALIQYTSGSTRAPKGVAITHENLVVNHQCIYTVMDYHSDSMLLGWLPHYHDMGFSLYMQPIFGGFDLVATTPAQFLRRPVLWLQLITRYRATSTVAPDFAYNLCARLVTDAQLATLDLSSLRTVITGAEPVRARTLNDFAARFASAGFDPGAFVPAYGMAEATVFISAKRSRLPVAPLAVDADALEQGMVRPAGEGRSLDVVPCGPPAPGHDVVIIDPNTGTPSPGDRVGEIWVRGPSVARGYWEQPEETAKKFRAELAEDRREYLRTGDLGFLSAGEVVITGRMSDVINVRGRNVYPSDLENAVSNEIASHIDPVSAAFEWADDVVVVVVEAGPRTAEAVAVAEDVRRRLAEKFSLEPLGLVVVRRGSIPRTSSGKVRRKATRDLLTAGELPVVFSTGLRLEAGES
ncbi:fatty acyl-AMP ligase [Sphaerimonospora sp. CA-214678]|uniref:fatty acyl-AMP ligase n=1 Tax=Sphaerimonospora sp. CA-214678 TaxID=3240029 RepID=UPI003D93D35F